MGKKGNWFIAVKKAFSHESKEKNHQKPNKSKKWGFGKDKLLDPASIEIVSAPPPPRSEEIKPTEAENKQTKHVHFSVVDTDEAATQPATEVVCPANVTQYSSKSKEEMAAIKIQTAFRGYLARRALRALRGLVRLKTLVHGYSVKRQATTTLQCMQTLARVQSQIHARRIRMSEENIALQRQLQQKREKELEILRMGEDWDHSLQSKEQVEANLLNKQEAAKRRERAMAYACSHQTRKNSSRSANPAFMDPNNPHWGWSWLERWMESRPWESQSMTEKELSIDHSSVKRGSRTGGGEISRTYVCNETSAERPLPIARKSSLLVSHQSPSTPPSKAASSSSVTGKLKSASQNGRLQALDDDTRSMLSMKSERYRRHSVAGSSVRDDESLASSPAFPSYMAPTKSAKARARLQSPLGVEQHETPEGRSVGSAKKRLSFSSSPSGPRRYSAPQGKQQPH